MGSVQFIVAGLGTLLRTIGEAPLLASTHSSAYCTVFMSTELGEPTVLRRSQESLKERESLVSQHFGCALTFNFIFIFSLSQLHVARVGWHDKPHFLCEKLNLGTVIGLPLYKVQLLWLRCFKIC